MPISKNNPEPSTSWSLISQACSRHQARNSGSGAAYSTPRPGAALALGKRGCGLHVQFRREGGSSNKMELISRSRVHSQGPCILLRGTRTLTFHGRSCGACFRGVLPILESLEQIESAKQSRLETSAVRGPLHSESRWRGGRTAKSGCHLSFRVDAACCFCCCRHRGRCHCSLWAASCSDDDNGLMFRNEAHLQLCVPKKDQGSMLSFPMQLHAEASSPEAKPPSQAPCSPSRRLGPQR